MMTLQLTPDLSQTFSTVLEGDRYDVSLYQSNAGFVLCDLSLNETVVLSGARVVGGQFFVPFPAYFVNHGNFQLLAQGDQLPNTTQFGTTQTLVYYTIAEMAAVLAGTLGS